MNQSPIHEQHMNGNRNMSLKSCVMEHEEGNTYNARPASTCPDIV